MYEFTITGGHILMAGAVLFGLAFVCFLILGRLKRKEREATLEEFIMKVQTGLNILGNLDRNAARYDSVDQIRKLVERWYNEAHQPQPDSPTEETRSYKLPNSARLISAVFINQNDPPTESWMAEADVILTPQGIIKNRHGETGRIVPQNERRVCCPNCGHENRYKYNRSDTGWTGIICTGCQLQFSCSLSHSGSFGGGSRCGNICGRCQGLITFVTLSGALVCSKCHPLLFERYCKTLTRDEIPDELFDGYLAHMPLIREVRVGGMVEKGTKVLWGDIEGEIVPLGRWSSRS